MVDARDLGRIRLGFMTWFEINDGRFTLTSGWGGHLYNRVVQCQKLLDPEGMAALPGVDLRELAHWEIADKLSPLMPSWAAVETMVRDIAVEGLRTDPVGYVKFSFGHAWRLTIPHPCVYLGCVAETYELHADLESAPLRQFSTSAREWQGTLIDAFAAVWPWLCWIGVLSMLLVPFVAERAVPIALFLLVAGYMLSTAFVEFYLTRYNVAVTQQVAALAIVPLAVLARASTWASSRERSDHPAGGEVAGASRQPPVADGGRGR